MSEAAALATASEVLAEDFPKLDDHVEQKDDDHSSSEDLEDSDSSTEELEDEDEVS